MVACRPSALFTQRRSGGAELSDSKRKWLSGERINPEPISGHIRAADLIDRMEAEGIIGRANHVGKREVLVRQPDEDF